MHTRYGTTPLKMAVAVPNWQQGPLEISVMILETIDNIDILATMNT